MGAAEPVPCVDLWVSQNGCAATGAAAADWWQARAQPEPRTDDAGELVSDEAAIVGAGWLLDRLDTGLEPVPASNRRWVAVDRLVLALEFASVLAVLLFASLGSFESGGIAMAISVILGVYVRARCGSRRLLRERHCSLHRLRHCRRSVRQAGRGLQRLGKALEDLKMSEESALKQAEDSQKSLLKQLETELSAIQQRSETIARQLKQRRADAESRRARESEQTLRRTQEDHVARALMGRSVSTINAYGIGDGRKQRLIAAGIRTAHDVSYSRVINVYGFGPELASAVANWRRQIEGSAAASAPTALSAAERTAIDQRHEAEIATIEREEAGQRQQNERDRERIVQRQQTASLDATAQMERIRRERAVPQQKREQEIAQTRRELCALLWEEARAEYDVQRFVGLGLKAFLMNVLGVRRMGP
jgi:hypothetical protein